VNARDNFWWTPLHHAAHAGAKSVVEYLLMNGARMEAPAINGTTPLTRAIESNCAEVVQYLIDHGARVRVENRCGKLSCMLFDLYLNSCH
jgi:ankyrin repeat protein